MEKQNYGVIFGDINLVSEEHLQAILDTLNRDTAQYFIIKSVLIAYQKGVYTLGESEIISKSIRLLSKPPEQTPENNA